MPPPPRTSASGVSADNIIEGSRKRARLEAEASNGQAISPASSASRLPDAASGPSDGPEGEQASQLGFKLLDVLINRIDEDDTPLSVPFLALPSRSDYPDYYDLIKNPVSLEEIRRRLQSRRFSSFEQVRNALETVCRNAKRYNQKGSEIYEKARTMHQIILHAYVDLVEKGDVQPLGDIVLKSEPSLLQQSARVAKTEKPNRRARLDYDELEGQEVAGRVTLRLKKSDDIDYEEDDEEGQQQEEEGGSGDGVTEAMEEEVEESATPVQQERPSPARASVVEEKREHSTPRMESLADGEGDEEDDGDQSSAPVTYDGEVEMVDGKPLDRSMLTLAGKFDRRKRPGPRGKRLKSSLRHLMGELKNALDRSGQPITRFFLSLPSRLQYPDYYKVIQRPVALDSIEDKVMKKGYANPHAMITDLRQMVENAQYYNEEGSEVWEAAEEVRQFVESTTVPTLLADGFTLDPDDMRQSALPVDIAANSTVPAQAAAFRIQTERRIAMENGTSNELVESVSPELPARSLIGSSENSKLKARLSSRANTSASPAPLAEMQPPVPAPSSSGLGLSVNDGSPAGQAQTTPQRYPSRPAVSYATPSSIPATPSSYLNTSMGLSSPSNMHMWPAGSPSTPSANSYFGNLSSGPQPALSNRQSSTSMAPPAPGPPNGFLPFQKPTNVQMQHQQQGGAPNPAVSPLPGGAPPRTSQHLSKHLQGEPPLFDPYQTNALQVGPDQSIVRLPVISHFDVGVEKMDGDRSGRWTYRLRNKITRMHTITVSSGPPESLSFEIEMTPKGVVQRQGEGAEDRHWTVSIHHNGKGIKPSWKEDERNGVGPEDTIGTAAAATAATSTSTRVQVPAGSPCRFTFVPHQGANIVNVHIYPPPPNSALQEIVKEEKHPLRSKAKALLDVPERYRILVYCQG